MAVGGGGRGRNRRWVSKERTGSGRVYYIIARRESSSIRRTFGQRPITLSLPVLLPGQLNLSISVPLRVPRRSFFETVAILTHTTVLRFPGRNRSISNSNYQGLEGNLFHGSAGPDRHLRRYRTGERLS